MKSNANSQIKYFQKSSPSRSQMHEEKKESKKQKNDNGTEIKKLLESLIASKSKY